MLQQLCRIHVFGLFLVLFLVSTACSTYKAIERSEGQFPPNAKCVVLVNGADALSLAGEVRNALRQIGVTVVDSPREATHNVNLSYSTSSKRSDIRLDRLTIELIDLEKQQTIARYLYDRNNENTNDWTWQIKDIIKYAMSNMKQ